MSFKELADLVVGHRVVLASEVDGSSKFVEVTVDQIGTTGVFVKGFRFPSARINFASLTTDCGRWKYIKYCQHYRCCNLHAATLGEMPRRSRRQDYTFYSCDTPTADGPCTVGVWGRTDSSPADQLLRTLRKDVFAKLNSVPTDHYEAVWLAANVDTNDSIGRMNTDECNEMLQTIKEYQANGIEALRPVAKIRTSPTQDKTVIVQHHKRKIRLD